MVRFSDSTRYLSAEPGWNLRSQHFYMSSKYIRRDSRTTFSQFWFIFTKLKLFSLKSPLDFLGTKIGCGFQKDSFRLSHWKFVRYGIVGSTSLFKKYFLYISINFPDKNMVLASFLDVLFWAQKFTLWCNGKILTCKIGICFADLSRFSEWTKAAVTYFEKRAHVHTQYSLLGVKRIKNQQGFSFPYHYIEKPSQKSRGIIFWAKVNVWQQCTYNTSCAATQTKKAKIML